MSIAIAELGHFALLLCLPLALVLGLLPVLGRTLRSPLLANSARPIAVALWLLMVLSFACLVHAFLHDDFSVRLVANHSNTALPGYYKFSAVWGNHEGSLLLWALVLSSWTALLAWRSSRLPEDIRGSVLATLGLVTLGIVAFIVFTSNPFERNLLHPPQQGSDLNPLLQDIGLILHPPLLYIGYVGFAVPFAFAIAALVSGRLDAAWVRWVRPWTNVAWSFLTLGIALGSWWAYYELGWGGWWFWDPVENASLMPWLSGTVLLHSLAATEKRGVFRNWTVLLAILTFSLSLMGTFLVRSGILVSVHAFASDPTRGLFILAFLSLVTGSSLLLYAFRASQIRPLGGFELVSRETSLLANNLLLSVALTIVLLGTLFPLIAAALELGSYSVGPPYFNRLFVPLMLPLLLVLGVAPYLNWKRSSSLSRLQRMAIPIAVIAVATGAGWVALVANRYAAEFSVITAVFVALACWVVGLSLAHPLGKALESGGGLATLKRFSGGYWGMLLAHIGVAVAAIGISFTVTYSQQSDVRMQVGDRAELAGYTFILESLTPVAGPNYSATRGELLILDATASNAPAVARLYPEKRLYHAGRNVMTEAGIGWGLSRDLYVSLGEQLDDDAWSLRLYVKAYVRLIWLGAMLMAGGGVLAVLDKRYRRRVRQRQDERPNQPVAAEG